MKISHTDIYRYSIPMVPFAIATGTMQFAQNIFIRIHTTDGLSGGGECSAFPYITGETQDTCLVMAKDFAALWKGKDPLEIELRMQELEMLTARNTTIKSAFDMALYDLAAKAASQPLYQFLGSSKKEVETDITIGIGQIAEMVQKALDFQQQGANILKVKVGKNAVHDVETLQQIRQAVKPEMKIRIDANQGWNYEDAVYALEAIQSLDIEFCEQPMRAWNDNYLPALCQTSKVPVMADESCYTSHDARRLIETKSCHSINIKLAKSGGILEALKIHTMAKEARIPCMIGGMLESRFALTANLHFALACDNVQYYDLDTCLLGHLADPVTNGATYNQFRLTCTDLPGIGADVDDAYLDKCEHWKV